MSSISASDFTALSSTLLSLSLVTVSLRFYARRKQNLQFKSDDWIMIPCLFMFLATTAITFYGLHQKVLGYPTPKDPQAAAETAPLFYKLCVTFGLFSVGALGCIKISALLFYRRIFCDRGHRRLINYLNIFSIVIVALWMVGYMILYTLACGTHFSAFWTSDSDYLKYCGAAHPFLLSCAISDFLLDVWILALPTPQIWAIQTTFRRKIAVTGVFLLAFVGLGACIARMIIFIQINNGTILIVDRRDSDNRQIYLVSFEVGLSLIAVNLPSLWPLLNKITPERITHCVRSIIFLRPLPSARSLGSKESRKPNRRPSRFDQRSNSISSLSHVIRPDAHYFETYVIHDQDEPEHRLELPLGKIHVTESMSHSTMHV